MAQSGIFVGQDGRFVATELARGPWDVNAQHGGAPAALLMREFERVPAADGLEIARVTYELLRPVPLGELTVSSEVIRSGGRVQLLEASIRAPDGTELVRARALQVRRAELRRRADARSSGADARSSGAEARESGAEPTIPAAPEQGREVPPPFEVLKSPTFAPDAIEIRFISGKFGGGPATAWFRMRVPLVEGEDPSPLQRLAAAGDFGNGISAVLPWDQYLFINPDLTLYIDRLPAGEWICLDARTIIPSDGVGIAESVIYDTGGRVGRAIQALLVGPR